MFLSLHDPHDVLALYIDVPTLPDTLFCSREDKAIVNYTTIKIGDYIMLVDRKVAKVAYFCRSDTVDDKLIALLFPRRTVCDKVTENYLWMYEFSEQCDDDTVWITSLSCVYSKLEVLSWSESEDDRTLIVVNCEPLHREVLLNELSVV